MGDILSSFFAGNLDLPPSDAGASYGGAHQVPVLINCIGLDCGPDEVLHKFFTEIFNVYLQQTAFTSTQCKAKEKNVNYLQF